MLFMMYFDTRLPPRYSRVHAYVQSTHEILIGLDTFNIPEIEIGCEWFGQRDAATGISTCIFY